MGGLAQARPQGRVGEGTEGADSRPMVLQVSRSAEITGDRVLSPAEWLILYQELRSRGFEDVTYTFNPGNTNVRGDFLSRLPSFSLLDLPTPCRNELHGPPVPERAPDDVTQPGAEQSSNQSSSSSSGRR